MPESNSSPLELRLHIETANGYDKEIDLLSDEVLAPFGKTKMDVLCARWTDHFSESIYTELGLAGPHHPLIGSGSAVVCFRSGEEGEYSDIFYQDYGTQSHHQGNPHWNHERRYTMEGWSKPSYEKHPIGTHIIDIAPWIQISASGSDGTLFIKKIPWIPET